MQPIFKSEILSSQGLTQDVKILLRKIGHLLDQQIRKMLVVVVSERAVPRSVLDSAP